jgi:hypothetical protein
LLECFFFGGFDLLLRTDKPLDQDIEYPLWRDMNRLPARGDGLDLGPRFI